MCVEQAPENDAQNDPTFSAASVFGMLLTLSTCLLLQPQGSLLVERPSGAVGRALFFFLRLNPLMCIMEAAAVLPALVLIFWRAIRSCDGTPFQESGVFAATLQAGAAGLLFLRSHTVNAPLDERLIEPAPKRGHTVMVLDVITMISVMCTAVKLGASVIPWHFRLVAWTYMVNWLLVQLVVMMSHFGSSKEQLDSKELLRSAEYLQQKDYVLGFGLMLGALAFTLLAIIGYIEFYLIVGICSGLLSLGVIFAIPVLGGWMYGSDPKDPSEPFITLTFFISLIGILAMFIPGLIFYDEEGTFKPEWLDWLG